MRSGLPIDIATLLARRDVESPRIEYKASVNPVELESAVRTICAFANDLGNVNGGYVIFGIEEENGRPLLPPRGIPDERLDKAQKELHGAIKQVHPDYSPLVVPERVGDATLLVVYCPPGPARPYEAPEALAQRAQRHAYVRSGSQTVKATGELARQLREVSARTPFDDQPRYDASVDDISAALVQHHLRQSESRLLEGRSDMAAIYRRMYLLARTNGHEVPRNVALLFFNEAPRTWFRGASIEVGWYPKGKGADEIFLQVFEGPVPLMLRLALDHLRGLITTGIRKLPDRAEAPRTESFPYAAVEEALVNAVHHRGYDVPDPIKVEVLPDALRIVSYPGPMPGFSLAELEAGDTPPVAGRNRRIAELLRQLDLAEAQGTGLTKMRQAMARNGSPPPRFRFDEQRTFFEVTLPIHPGFATPSVGPRAQPLRLGRAAPPEEVVGRDALVGRVLRAAEDQNVVLLGPRGRGTSSVLGLIAARIPSEQAVFHLDLTGIGPFGWLGALVEWADGQLDERPAQRQQLQAIAATDHRSGHAMVKAIAATIELLAPRPVTLVLDGLDAIDEDWADPWEDLWSYLGNHLTGDARVRVIGASSTPNANWAPHVTWVHVPPLGSDDARELAARLLRGLDLADDQGCADALATLSGGIPGLLVHLVSQLRVTRDASPEGAQLALDALALDPTDPSGLTGRVARFKELFITPHGYRRIALDSAQYAILASVASSAAGRRRLDAIAGAIGPSVPRLSVLKELKELEDLGYIVEVDGHLRLEHPWLREVWLAFQTAPPPPPPDPDLLF